MNGIGHCKSLISCVFHPNISFYAGYGLQANWKPGLLNRKSAACLRRGKGPGTRPRSYFPPLTVYRACQGRPGGEEVRTGVEGMGVFESHFSEARSGGSGSCFRLVLGALGCRGGRKGRDAGKGRASSGSFDCALTRSAQDDRLGWRVGMTGWGGVGMTGCG